MKLVVSVMIICVVGCAEPTVTGPLGTVLEDESLAKLSGVWRAPDGKEIHVKHVGNRLFMGILEFDSGQTKFRAVNTECILTTDGNHRFAFFKHLGESEEFYFYEVVEMTDESVALRSPDSDVFLEGVRDGAIPGQIVDQRIRGKNYQRARLDVNEDSFFGFLRKNEMNICFPKDSEVTYRKEL